MKADQRAAVALALALGVFTGTGAYSAETTKARAGSVEPAEFLKAFASLPVPTGGTAEKVRFTAFYEVASKDVEEVAAFYRQELAKQGWSPDPAPVMKTEGGMPAGMTQLNFERSGVKAAVILHLKEGGVSVVVTLAAG